MYPLFTKRITIYAVNPETARQTAVYNKSDDTYCSKPAADQYEVKGRITAEAARCF